MGRPNNFRLSYGFAPHKLLDAVCLNPYIYVICMVLSLPESTKWIVVGCLTVVTTGNHCCIAQGGDTCLSVRTLVCQKRKGEKEPR